MQRYYRADIPKGYPASNTCMLTKQLSQAPQLESAPVFNLLMIDGTSNLLPDFPLTGWFSHRRELSPSADDFGEILGSQHLEYNTLQRIKLESVVAMAASTTNAVAIVGSCLVLSVVALTPMYVSSLREEPRPETHPVLTLLL
jgi:hypothetical protein